MIRNLLINWLGGFTPEEFMKQTIEWSELCLQQRADMGATIRELQALIPVSAVTPKKRGRPRKKTGEWFVQSVPGGDNRKTSGGI